MKTMKLFMVVAAATLISGGVYASGNLKVNFTGVRADMAVIEISNTNLSTFEIEVKNEDGEVIFWKETQTPSTNYKRTYDFSKLEEGNYFLTVNIDREKQETKFAVENGTLRMIEEKKMLEPFFFFNENELKMTYLNFAGENTSLHIYDENRNELYARDFNDEFNVQHGLNMTKLPKGSYEVVLSTESNSYNYEVAVK